MAPRFCREASTNQLHAAPARGTSREARDMELYVRLRTDQVGGDFCLQGSCIRPQRLFFRACPASLGRRTDSPPPELDALSLSRRGVLFGAGHHNVNRSLKTGPHQCNALPAAGGLGLRETCRLVRPPNESGRSSPSSFRRKKKRKHREEKPCGNLSIVADVHTLRITFTCTP